LQRATVPHHPEFGDSPSRAPRVDSGSLSPRPVNALKSQHLARLPDLPCWVETRALLADAASVLVPNADGTGFVVWNARDRLGAVVGVPAAAGLGRAAMTCTEILAFADNVRDVADLLPEFGVEEATILRAPAAMPSSPLHRCDSLDLAALESMVHVPEDVRHELAEVVYEGGVVLAAFEGALPVAFAYVASETESWWDLSIETLASHRRRGFATAVVVALMRRMQLHGKSGVWGALVSNTASLALAHHLGFTEAGSLWVLTRRDG